MFTTLTLIGSLLAMCAALGLSVFMRKSEPARAAQALSYVVEAKEEEYIALLRVVLELREGLKIPIDLLEDLERLD